MYVAQVSNHQHLYGRRVYLFVGTRDELAAHLTEKWGEKAVKGVPRDCVGLAHYFKVEAKDGTDGQYPPGVRSRVYYIWIWRYRGNVEDLGILVHECFHTATAVLSDLGVDTDDADGSESLAYYLDWMFRQCLEALNSRETVN